MSAACWSAHLCGDERGERNKNKNKNKNKKQGTKDKRQKTKDKTRQDAQVGAVLEGADAGEELQQLLDGGKAHAEGAGGGHVPEALYHGCG